MEKTTPFVEINVFSVFIYTSIVFYQSYYLCIDIRYAVHIYVFSHMTVAQCINASADLVADGYLGRNGK